MMTPVASTTARRSNGIRSRVSLPASIFEKSRMSLMIVSRPSAGASDDPGYSRWSPDELGGSSSSWVMPDDRVHGGADLVAHVGQELALRPIAGLCRFLFPPQSLGLRLGQPEPHEAIDHATGQRQPDHQEGAGRDGSHQPGRLWRQRIEPWVGHGAGFRKEDHGGHARVMHAGDGAAHDQGRPPAADPAPSRFVGSEMERERQRPRRRGHGNEDGCEEGGGAVGQPHAVVHRRHAGIVHAGDGQAEPDAARISRDGLRRERLEK